MKKIAMRHITIFILLAFHLSSHRTDACLEKYSTCGCKNSKGGKDSAVRGKKLTCRDVNVVDLFANGDFPEDYLISFDLRANKNLRELSKETFGHKTHTLHILQGLLKLDFSQNDIWKIAAETFTLFPNLTRLNLSRNSIGWLSPDMFLGLIKLEVLDLSQNIFPIIPGDAFNSLVNLKKLSIKSTDLVCNCLMKDFVKWVKTTSVRVFGTCHLPQDLRDDSLKSLVPDDMKCDPNNTLTSLPYCEMTPSVPQLTFEGDTLRMQCEGTNLPHSEVFWTFNGKPLNFDEESALSVNVTSNLYKSIITGWLTIGYLTENHTGTWNCTVKSEHGSETKMVKIRVIRRNFKYCGEQRVKNDKGAFTWPSTISGVTRTVECPEKSKAYEQLTLEANRKCIAGNWSMGKYDTCPYEDYVNDWVHYILHEDLKASNVDSLLNRLLKHIVGKTVLFPFSVDLIGNLTEKVLPLINDDNKEKISTPLLKLASYVMQTNTTILEAAQQNTGACNKVLSIVRAYTLKRASSAPFDEESKNIAIGGSKVLEKGLYNEAGDGMSCKVLKSNENLKFACDMSKTKGHGLQPSISFPKTLLDSCKDETDGYRLYFIAYRHGGLFQRILTNKADGNVTTGTLHTKSSGMVLETGIRGCNIMNLSDPIIFNFETTAPGSYYPVIWSPQGWTESDDCSAYCINRNFTQVVCHKISTVTLIQDSNSMSCGKDAWLLMDLAHPATLVGTVVLASCLITVILSYVCCSGKMRMSSDSRHMLVNICVHLLLASCMFAFCIRRVDHRAVCVACGIVLHYTSLAVLLWITLSVRNIYRELAIHTRPPSLEPKPPRPMLRFYLIGCGIPIVICGITAAAKVQNYAGDEGKVEKYCWLSWETSIYAFYSPAAFIAVVCISLLIRVLCAFSRLSGQFDTPRSPLARSSWQGNARLANNSDRYQAIATEDAAPFQNNTRSNNGTRSPLHPVTSFHIASGGNEQSFKTQLCGTALLFIFYLLTWVSAALSIAAPSVQGNTPSQGQNVDALNYMDYSYLRESASVETKSTLGEAFSYAYAIMAMVMGIFIVLQHLACRKDVRLSWKNMFPCLKLPGGYTQGQEVRTSSPKLEENDKGNIANDQALEYLTSSNDKSLNKNREGVYPSIKTDPTLETVVHSTDTRKNGTANASQHMQYHQSTLTKSCLNHGSDFQPDCLPCSIQESGRPAKSITSLHSSCRVKHLDHAPNGSYRGHSHMRSSSGHRHIPHPYAHEHYNGLSPQGGYIPNPHSYRHHGFHNHHLAHQQHSKPVKMTNLHMAHNDSTEHSFDEMGNNMHTIPVIMQHPGYPKVNNGALADRYQKMRKALDRKRAKQKKLNVLREYAQDPLTSNDEGQRDEKGGGVTEASPLLLSPDSVQPNGAANSSAIQGAQKYRPLLISPSNKKQEAQKSKNTGPTKRVKRLDSSGQPRPLRTDKRRQNSRMSHNSTLSERERDTSSSEKSTGRNNDLAPVSRSANNAVSVTKHNFDLNATTDGGAGKDSSHGYLTLQQLQSTNPFLFHNQGAVETKTESSPTVPDAKLEDFKKSNQIFSNSSPNSSRVLSNRNETSV